MGADEFNNDILADYTFYDEREVHTIRLEMSKVDTKVLEQLSNS